MKKTFALPLIALTLIAGCAQIRHTVTQIDTDVFQVGTETYGGYGNTDISNAAVTRAALVAAATAAKGIGCTYFAAINNTTQNFAQTQQQTTGDSFVRNNDGSVQYRTAQGQQYRIITPTRRSTYVCFKDKPTALLPGLIFNADLVSKTN
jgi:hypothetical protein